MILGHIVCSVLVWRRYRAGVRELTRLSDSELADIGVARSGIPWIAWRSALQRQRATISARPTVSEAPGGGSPPPRSINVTSTSAEPEDERPSARDTLN